MSMSDIAKKFQVTRSAISFHINRQPHIPFEYIHIVLQRDNHLCVVCHERPGKVKVCNRSNQVDIDNLGVICGKCSAQLTRAKYYQSHPHEQKKCSLEGCVKDNLTQSIYCCPEHKREAYSIRFEARRLRYLATAQRECNYCGVVKQVSEFYVHQRQNKNPTLYAACKLCHNARASAYIKRIRKDKTSVKYKRFVFKQYAAHRRWSANKKQKSLERQKEQLNDPKVQALLEKLRGLI